MECQNCGHKWVPRVERPLTCPRCKNYDYNTAKPAKLNNLAAAANSEE